MDAISLDAVFAKGTLYNYFQSKEHLFAEVVTEACRRAVQRNLRRGRPGIIAGRGLGLPRD